MTSRIVLCIAMVLALAGATPGLARADWDDRPDASEYDESLDPHGYWVDDPSYGRVWRPYTDWGWRPYVDGQWIWTSYGWTWSSPEPWGWTFHYGRWGFSNLYGWVWTPGNVWGPAWVDWYWGDGYVGWVPLAPVGFAIVPGYWNYVRDYSFCSPHINNVIIVHDRLPRFIVHHRDHGWGSRHSPDFRDIEHVSRHRIVRESDRPRDSVAPWVRHRIERGERVRERIADRGGERVIEHGGRRGPERRDRPDISDDAWRRRGDDRDGGRIIERGRGRAAREPDGRVLEHGNRDDRSRGAVVEVPGRRPHDGDEGNRRVEPRDRSDEGRGTARPSPRDDDGGVWTRQRRAPETPRARPMERSADVPGMPSRGGGHGGGSMVERGRGGGDPGGGRASGPMVHGGGGGGGGRPSASPSASQGGGGHGGGRGGGADHGTR